ncbi:hypothetical protein ACHAPU_010736 [Fusarium lateritium]
MICGSPDFDNYTLTQDPFHGDVDYGQPGLILTTSYDDNNPRWFMVYQNMIDFKPFRAMKERISSCSSLIRLTSY